MSLTKSLLSHNHRTSIPHLQVANANTNSISSHGSVHQILQMGIPGDSTYANLLQDCVIKKFPTEGKLLHAHIILTGFVADLFIETKLVLMYAKCGILADARKILEAMPRRNVVSWTVMIAAYVRHGFRKEAIKAFYEMQRTGIQPNHFTFTSFLPVCANMAGMKHGKEVHEAVIKRGYQSNVYVGSALVDMYVKGGSIEDAVKVFDKMPERNVVSWNAMMAGYVQTGLVDKAHELFEKMPERSVVSWTTMVAGYVQNGCVDDAMKLFRQMPERNVVSWTAMIAGYVQSGYLNEALELFEEMPERDVVSWTAMIAGFAQNGHVDEALKLFQKTPLKDVFPWNAMIAGYAQNGCFEEALKLFQKMHGTCVKPDSDTFASVLSSCANLACLGCGKHIHGGIIRSGFEHNVFVGSTLVDMYGKCGNIKDARTVFDAMPGRDVVSWNAMIVGYAIQGCGKEALCLFEQMKQYGLKPDHVSLVGVLSACCHAGLVDIAWQYFHSMSHDYHITPAAEHYSCMVDLLGRAGLLYEAQNLINNMPVKPSAFVWGSLLAACKIHINVELGEYVAEHLFELDSENAAHYVLLSNIYAAAGRWDGVEKVRKLMKDRKVKKKPGCSWIEVNSKVYTFLIGDRSHPQTVEIYAELEKLFGQMKEAGYIPDMSFVFHDAEEWKGHILCHDS